jgi:hypothetical protein
MKLKARHFEKENLDKMNIIKPNDNKGLNNIDQIG